VTVGVVFLARAAETRSSFVRFAQSYRRHPAGCEHELIVIYKGFSQQSELHQARAVFADLPHRSIEVADVGFDIGSYITASSLVEHRYLCFCNTFTELAADGWLKHLLQHARSESVGIAGAMGSYESLFATNLLLRKVRWTHDRGYVDGGEQALAHYFDFLLAPLQDAERRRIAGPTAFARLPAAVKNLARAPWFYWDGLSRVWPGPHMGDIHKFPDFPNPHIRSNGFVIRRDWLLRFDPARMRSKSDTTLF